jgi:hypothetical protein
MDIAVYQGVVVAIAGKRYANGWLYFVSSVADVPEDALSDVGEMIPPPSHHVLHEAKINWQGPGWYARWEVANSKHWHAEYLADPPESGDRLQRIAAPKFSVNSVALTDGSEYVFVVGREVVNLEWMYTTSDSQLWREDQLSPVKHGWEGPGYYSYVDAKNDYRNVYKYDVRPKNHNAMLRIPEIDVGVSLDEWSERARGDGVRLKGHGGTIRRASIACNRRNEVMANLYDPEAYVKIEETILREDVWKGPGWYYYRGQGIFIDFPKNFSESLGWGYGHAALCSISAPLLADGDVAVLGGHPFNDTKRDARYGCIKGISYKVDQQHLDAPSLLWTGAAPGEWQYQIGGEWHAEAAITPLSTVIDARIQQAKEEMRVEMLALIADQKESAAR